MANLFLPADDGILANNVKKTGEMITMAITITVLSENTSGHDEGLLAEHGLALHLKVDEQKILFDTGQSDRVLLNNASRLGVNLGEVERMIISHGHWDHVGGIPGVLQLHDEALPVHLHPDAFAERYYTKVRRGVSELRDAGIRYSKTYLESSGADFKTNTTPLELVGTRLILTGEVPMLNDFEQVAPQLKIRQGEELIPDAVIDEQSLILDSPEGLVIVMGCGHPGMVNIIHHAIQLTGKQKIRAVIGGTHLMFQDDRQIHRAIEELSKLDIEIIGTSHCTGARANSMIRSAFPDKFMACNVGTVLEFQ